MSKKLDLNKKIYHFINLYKSAKDQDEKLKVETFFDLKNLRSHGLYSSVQNHPTRKRIEKYMEETHELYNFSYKLLSSDYKKYKRKSDEMKFITSEDIHKFIVQLISISQWDSEDNTVRFFTYSSPFNFLINLEEKDLIKQVLEWLKSLNDFFSSHQSTIYFELYLWESPLKKIKTILIDNERVTIKWNWQKLEFKAIANWSENKIYHELTWNIELLILVLEYEWLIKYNHNVNPLTNTMFTSWIEITDNEYDIKIQWSCKNNQNLSYYLTFLEKRLKGYLIWSWRHIWDIAKLFSDSIWNHILAPVLNFLKDWEKINSAFEFLQYRVVIETLLWSPETDIKNRLEHAFKIFFPHEDKKYFWELYKDRCSIVHNWKVWISSDKIDNIRNTAKQLFNMQIKSAYVDSMAIRTFYEDA